VAVLSKDSYARRRNVRHIAGRDVIFDQYGYLQNPFTWSEEVARHLAREAGIENLSDRHWRVLRFVRSYYLEEGKEPVNHKIKLGTGMSIKEILELFPEGINRGVKRLAGLPRPKGCAAS
jgi:TusE/DsrC/DsvC family sulfur relay protein